MESFVSANARGECPHCRTFVMVHTKPEWQRIKLDVLESDPEGDYEEARWLHVGQCPMCKGLIIDTVDRDNMHDDGQVNDWQRLYPQPTRVNAPPEVPGSIRENFSEATKVAKISQKAAAALARRCLQDALRDRGFKRRSLEEEIAAAQQDGGMPSTLVQKLHIVRQVGNYAAHSTTTSAGELLEVAPGEVEALIGALLELFDHFYVRPLQHKKILADVNAKLIAAKKPPIT